MKRLASLVVAGLAMQAMAGNPTTHRSFPLLTEPQSPAPTVSSFNPNDFNLNYRPQPLQPGLGTITIGPARSGSNDAQLWHSSQFNGGTVWNRPAIFDTTVHAVKDANTGTLFYYRDFANTVKVPLEFQAYRITSAGHRVPEPDLIDDRPKQK